VQGGGAAFGVPLDFPAAYFGYGGEHMCAYFGGAIRRATRAPAARRGEKRTRRRSHGGFRGVRASYNERTHPQSTDDNKFGCSLRSRFPAMWRSCRALTRLLANETLARSSRRCARQPPQAREQGAPCAKGENRLSHDSLPENCW
jgi:hypothetical protein